MRSFLRIPATVIALGAISFFAYGHYRHRHGVLGTGGKPVRLFGLGPPIDRALVIRPKKIDRSIAAGDHVAILIAKSVLFSDMYVLKGTDGKTVTLRATRNQAAALIRLSRPTNRQLVVQRKPADPQQTVPAHSPGATPGFSLTAVKRAFVRHGVRLRPVRLHGGVPTCAPFLCLVGEGRASVRVDVEPVSTNVLFRWPRHIDGQATGIRAFRFSLHRNVYVWWHLADRATVEAALSSLK